MTSILSTSAAVLHLLVGGHPDRGTLRASPESMLRCCDPRTVSGHVKMCFPPLTIRERWGDSMCAAEARKESKVK
jgi:hypothetical protein